MKKNQITTALLAVLPVLAFAQADKNVKLDEIKVYSAYAAPINQDKTASSVTVLTEKDFAARNATYVSDVLKTVPGVAMGATGGRGAVTSAFVRGGESNHTTVVIDGVKMNPATDGFDFGGLSLNNIERIEILRGEQSALWGSDAIGGVVYITTKTGLYKDKPFNIDFNLGAGSHGTYDASATVSGFNNGFYYSMNSSSGRSRGISVMSADKFYYKALDGDDVDTGGATERDKYHRDSVSLKLGYDDNQKGIELLASNTSYTTGNDTSLFSERPDDFRNRQTLFKLGGYLGNDSELLKHKASVSHIKHDYNYRSQSPYSYDWKKFNTNYQLDVNFDREGSVTQAVSLVADYQRFDYESASLYGSLQNKKLTEKSIAAEYRLFTEQDHSLAISGRYTGSSAFDNSITARIASAYRLSPNMKLHTSVGTAVHHPTITEYFGYSDASKYIGNPALKAEKSRGGELGFLLETTDKRHSLDTTYFARIIDRFIGSESLGNGVSRAVNAEGKTRVNGVELVYQGKFTDSLNIFANYTYTQTKNGQQRKGETGLALDRRPKHMANAGLNFQATPKLGTHLSVNYVGKRLDTYYGRWPSKRVQLPSYTLVNTGVNYQLSKNLNVYADLNNLFNKKYESAVEYGQFGRNVYVGLKGSF